MKKTSKIIVTIVLIIVWFFLSSIVIGVRTDAGHSTPGFLGIILLAALIGGLKAIWKKDKDDNNNALQE